MLPSEAAAAVQRFTTQGLTGSITLHFAQGHVASVDVREIHKPGRPPIEIKAR